MPVDFLTKEQEQRYGRYASEPTAPQLARFFHLADNDLKLALKKHGAANQLGFALQLATVRFLGNFLLDPTEVPAGVISHLGQQLGITNPGVALSHYLDRQTTHYEHAAQIKQLYGYRDFHSQPHHFQLVRWLYTRAWLSSERPSLLFDLTTAYLVERKILLPGISVLERVVASARDRAALHLWKLLAGLPSPVQQAKLEKLLEVVPPDRQSPLDKLRQPPFQISSKSLVEALKRVETIRELEVGKLKMERIPPIRLKVLARYVNGVRAQALERLSPDRRIASLLAFAWVALATTQDDSLEVLEQLTTSLLARAETAGLKERLRTLPELDEAALQLKLACEVLLDAEVEAIQVRPTVYLRISAAQLRLAMVLVGQLARPNKEDNYYELLLERYKVVRNFLPKLLTTIQF